MKKNHRNLVWLLAAIAVYGVANYLSGKKYLPGCSFAELRPQVCLPIFMGIYFGPVYGFLTGAAGDSLGYVLAFSNPLPLWHWALANGLMGTIAGLAGRFRVRCVTTLKQMQVLYGLLLLSTTVPFMFSCGMEWIKGHVPLRETFMLLFLPIAVTDALFALILIPLFMLAARLLIITLPTATFLLTSYLTSLVVLMTFAITMLTIWGWDALSALAPTTLYTVGLICLAMIVSGFVLSAYFVRRITGPLVVLTDAADAIAHEQYEKAGALRPIQSRNDEFGRLAGAFGFMLEKVRAREEKLKKEVRELHIQIDKTRQRQEVSRITGSDYFIKLKQKAADMRRQNG